MGIFGSKFDSLLLLPIAWSLFLSRSNWTSLTAPIIRAGDGPDTSQNLMTALSARTLGNTWWSQANNINSFFGHDSLRQSVMDLYRYPSFRDQAGFDYLVFGTRWGLSVPYSQILRFFGDFLAPYLVLNPIPAPTFPPLGFLNPYFPSFSADFSLKPFLQPFPATIMVKTGDFEKL